MYLGNFGIFCTVHFLRIGMLLIFFHFQSSKQAQIDKNTPLLTGEKKVFKIGDSC